MALVVTACHTYAAPQTLSPALLASTHRPVHIVLCDHSTIDLDNAVVVGDSVIGRTVAKPQHRAAIATADVASISVQTISKKRSILLGAGIYEIVGGMALFVVLYQLGHIGSH